MSYTSYTFSASEVDSDHAPGSLGCEIHSEILKNDKKAAACNFRMNIES